MCAEKIMKGLKMRVVRGARSSMWACYLWDTLWTSSQYCLVDGHTSQDFKTYKTLLKCVYLQISKECIEIRHFKGKGWGSKKWMQPLGGQTVLPWIPTDRSVYKKPSMTKHIKSCRYTGWVRTEQGYEMLSYRDYWWTWKDSHQEWW